MRFVLLAAFALAAIACATASARAATPGKVEFCPATASVPFPAGATFGMPARTFDYDLTALTPRNVNAVLIADTTAGWYSWSVANVALAESRREPHLRAMPPQFRLMPYVIAASPTLAVNFPTALAIRHLWVASAQGTSCDVPAFEGPSDTIAPDPSDVAPTASSLYPVSVAMLSRPPFAASGCDQPFAAGTVIKAEAPDYPVSARQMDLGQLGVAVEVALTANGDIAGAWVYAGSGYSPIDRAALDAALKSKYRGSISYCRPVNGTYLFLANFMPGG